MRMALNIAIVVVVSILIAWAFGIIMYYGAQLGWYLGG